MVLTLGRSKIDENTFHNDIRPWEFSQSPLNTWFMKRICMQYYRIIFKTWYPRVHFASKRRKLNADFSKFMTNLGPFSWLRFWKISEHSKFNKKKKFLKIFEQKMSNKFFNLSSPSKTRCSGVQNLDCTPRHFKWLRTSPRSSSFWLKFGPLWTENRRVTRKMGRQEQPNGNYVWWV